MHGCRGDEDVRLECIWPAGIWASPGRRSGRPLRKAVSLSTAAGEGGLPAPRGRNVELAIPEAAPSSVQAEDIPLSIAFEDEHLLVVDKPAEWSSTGGGAFPRDPCACASPPLPRSLRHRRGAAGRGSSTAWTGTPRAALVAKTDEAHRGLTTQFRDRRIDKTYLALVLGTPRTETGEILLPVGRHPADRKKMSTRSSRGREAVTRWRVRERFGSVTLLEVDLLTGRTHQIRVHLSSQGYPVVGDAVYGRSGLLKSVTDTETRSILRGVKRQALHAARIAFRHPVHGTFLSFQSPLPEDMAGLCEALRGRRTYV
jgi:23S rRNA pseudouridine1911/1915/1917 synthase